MAGKENCQYITFGWVLSASLELKVLKDRMWYNLGRPRSVGSSEKYPFKGSSHKVLKMFCDKDGSQGAGEVFVVSRTRLRMMLNRTTMGGVRSWMITAATMSHSATSQVRPS